MTIRVYQTTVIAQDGTAAVEMLSVPRGTMPLGSKHALEAMLNTELTIWEPLLPQEPSQQLHEQVGQLLSDTLGGHLAPGHMDEVMADLNEIRLIPVEQSDPVLQSLATMGGGAGAAAALLYGVGAMGPIAVVALPAGIFLWYVAKPAGEGVGGWIKSRLLGSNESEGQKESPGA